MSAPAKLPSNPLGKAPEAPELPPVDELAKGLGRLVRHRATGRKLSRTPLDKPIRQAAAAANLRREQHLRDQQVLAQKRTARAQQAQSQAQTAQGVVDIAKATGTLRRRKATANATAANASGMPPEGQQTASPSPQVVLHTSPQKRPLGAKGPGRPEDDPRNAGAEPATDVPPGPVRPAPAEPPPVHPHPGPGHLKGPTPGQPPSKRVVLQGAIRPRGVKPRRPGHLAGTPSGRPPEPQEAPAPATEAPSPSPSPQRAPATPQRPGRFAAIMGALRDQNWIGAQRVIQRERLKRSTEGAATVNELTQREAAFTARREEVSGAPEDKRDNPSDQTARTIQARIDAAQASMQDKTLSKDARLAYRQQWQDARAELRRYRTQHKDRTT